MDLVRVIEGKQRKNSGVTYFCLSFIIRHVFNTFSLQRAAFVGEKTESGGDTDGCAAIVSG